ncbi:MAG: hypothetical protein AAFV53_28070 [Myxococcota bacterium]
MNTTLLLMTATAALAADPITPDAEAMMRWHLSLWEDASRRGAAFTPMRSTNPEWDFMARTFVVLGLSNVALAQPDRAVELLPVIDTIIEDTIRYEASFGQASFLLSYAQARPWKDPSEKSLFIDGEIALMIGARRMVKDDGRWNDAHHPRIESAVGQIARSPSMLGESYPDETWLFCNTVALAAVSVYDALEEGSDHTTLVDAWVERMKAEQLDPATGLLVSSTTWAGERKDGPEGSTIWLASHMLQFIDPIFAQDQYDRARDELGRTLLGMGYALEWPVGQENHVDVDAGEIVPILGASTASSGLAIVAARSFEDDRWHRALMRALERTAEPERIDGQLRYRRSNPVGDAVIFYGMVEGPMRRATADLR